jgi:nucleoside-diphosphate-sugar epimerase
MMYMTDCLKATIDIMEADNAKLKSRIYNVTGCSFTPKEIAASIAKQVPGFKISYAPDFRQAIADSWPRSIDDSQVCVLSRRCLKTLHREMILRALSSALIYAFHPIDPRLIRTTSQARADWGWRPEYDLDAMVAKMLTRLKEIQTEQAAKR